MGRVGMRAATESTANSTRWNGHPGRSLTVRRQTNNEDASRPAVGASSRRLKRFVSNRQERALKLFRTLTASAFIAAAAIGPALAIDISGAGATFPYPIYAKWADAYKKETNVGLNYQSIGSGGGIKQIKAKTVAVGATAAPLGGKEFAGAPFVESPWGVGGSVRVANIDGVMSGDPVTAAPTLAKVFLG